MTAPLLAAAALAVAAGLVAVPARGRLRRTGAGRATAPAGAVPDRAGSRRNGGAPGRRRALVPLIGGLALLAIGTAVAGPTGALVTAVALPGTVAALRRVADRAEDRPADPGVPLALDLVAALLRAGCPPGTALVAAAPAAGRDGAALARTGALLRLGAEPVQAWSPLEAVAPLAEFAARARRSGESGIRLAEAAEQVAATLRSDALVAVEARAQRLGTLGVLPLGLCFLPAFACLGVAPVIIGLARTVLPAIGP